MIAGKMKYVKTHECIKNSTNIAIEQYTDCHVSHWYLNIENKLHGIKYCPYCGKDLYEISVPKQAKTKIL